MNFCYTYAIVWTVMVLLYSFRFSDLNQPLAPELYMFLAISIALASMCGLVLKKHVQWESTLVKPGAWLTVGICCGFLATFAYMGGPAILSPYSGFDPDLASNEQVAYGIPYFTSLLISIAIYYAFYLDYLIIKSANNMKMRKQCAVELLCILFMFILNNSRGYIAFVLLVLLMSYLSENSRKLKNMKITIIPIVIVLFILVIFFISVAGNIRSGYAWNDYEYIERIGKYDNLPKCFPKSFLWAYTYTTSSLANLNLNILNENHASSIALVFVEMLPVAFTKNIEITQFMPKELYNVKYLNSPTCFTPYYVADGYAGLVFFLIFQFAIYMFIRFLLRRIGVLQDFGDVVLSFLILCGVFYNPMAAAAVCYVPLLLVITALYVKRKAAKNVKE